MWHRDWLSKNESPLGIWRLKEEHSRWKKQGEKQTSEEER